MKWVQRQLHAFPLAGRTLQWLRVGVWPLLAIWTLVRYPATAPTVLIVGVVLLAGRIGRRRHWPIPDGVRQICGIGFDLGLALVLPLLTGGWFSVWVLDAWIVLAMQFSRSKPQRRSYVVLLWLGCVGLLTLATSASEWLIFAGTVQVAVPLLLALTVHERRIDHEPAPPIAPIADQLRLVLQRFEQIDIELGEHAPSRDAGSIFNARMQAMRGAQEARALLNLLEPAAIHTSDTLTRITAVLHQWQAQHSLMLATELPTMLRPVPPVIESIVLRALGETLANIDQHAQATNVTISMRVESDDLVLVVRDDGIGLRDGTADRPGTHGLRALRYRVQEVNGQMDIYEGADGGLVVQISMPLGVYVV